MKETKLIKFNIFLLILSLCIIFSVSLTRDYLIKAAKPASAEEPGIPLETYLNGSYKNITDIEYNHGKTYSHLFTEHNYKLSPKGHISQKDKAFSSINFYHDFNDSITPGVNLKISKYKNYNDFAGGNFKNNYYKGAYLGEARFNFNSRKSAVWDGYEIIYNFSYYRGGKNIYTKNIHLKQNPTYGQKIVTPIAEIKNIDKQKPGLYVLEIKLVKHLLGYWDTHDEYIAFKNIIYAFQIGDGEDLG